MQGITHLHCIVKKNFPLGLDYGSSFPDKLRKEINKVGNLKKKRKRKIERKRNIDLLFQ